MYLPILTRSVFKNDMKLRLCSTDLVSLNLFPMSYASADSVCFPRKLALRITTETERERARERAPSDKGRTSRATELSFGLACT